MIACVMYVGVLVVVPTGVFFVICYYLGVFEFYVGAHAGVL